MTTKTLSKSELAQFTGSDNWYRHTINRDVLYTDGAQHVAEHGGAYWLLDEIAIIQPYNKAVAAEDFQVWKLAVRPDRTASLTVLPTIPRRRWGHPIVKKPNSN